MPPTVRTTTARLKKTMAAMIATGVPSSRNEPSRPDGASKVRNATPTTTVGSTNGITTNARRNRRPGSRRRYSAKVSGSPSSTVTTVARAADHTVNQSTSCVRLRVSTSSAPRRSSSPSGQSPRASIPPTGQDEEDQQRAERDRRECGDPGAATPASGHGRQGATSCQSRSQVSRFSAIDDSGTFQGFSAVGAKSPQDSGRPTDGVHGVDVHVVGQRLLERLADHEVDERLGALQGSRRPSSTAAYSTCRKQVSSSALVVGSSPPLGMVNGGELA